MDLPEVLTEGDYATLQARMNIGRLTCFDIFHQSIHGSAKSIDRGRLRNPFKHVVLLHELRYYCTLVATPKSAITAVTDIQRQSITGVSSSAPSHLLQ